VGVLEVGEFKFWLPLADIPKGVFIWKVVNEILHFILVYVLILIDWINIE
jgi:hypothetical protein